MASMFVGTAIAGVLLLAVVLFILRGMKWRSYDFSFGREEQSPADVLAGVVAHPATWGLGFLLLVLGTMTLALAAVGALPVALPGGIVAVAGAFGALILVFLAFGTYGFMRSRSRSHAESVVMSLFLLAMLFALAITANLAIA